MAAWMSTSAGTAASALSHNILKIHSLSPPRNPIRAFHYTPKHASWLNMAEIEISVLHGQCLNRRIGERDVLSAEIEAWERQRNASGARVRWKFTTDKARAKLARAYPHPTNTS